MTLPRPARCPECGGNLYLEPDLVEATAELVCLQCSRRIRHRPGQSIAEALQAASREGASVAAPDGAAR